MKVSFSFPAPGLLYKPKKLCLFWAYFSVYYSATGYFFAQFAKVFFTYHYIMMLLLLKMTQLVQNAAAHILSKMTQYFI